MRVTVLDVGDRFAEVLYRGAARAVGLLVLPKPHGLSRAWVGRTPRHEQAQRQPAPVGFVGSPSQGLPAGRIFIDTNHDRCAYFCGHRHLRRRLGVGPGPGLEGVGTPSVFLGWLRSPKGL
ncbi:hypothetical protein GCM10012286_22190 [Streptomyces lasiicapitis]|uniref:Uncharacterized protein n=1 Tax=Streptomyces lasiicapitis TaxID=1923961 RepID=A0ABQ2LQT0_9ACTN|nr:hypothetical protein GCM10012286_22190 [Streptomyces lasiicapitis]